jgi:UDP-N-acetylmuramate dehydrogenase
MDIREQVSLKEFTTFRIGGAARYFAACSSVADIQQALTFARDNNLPVFVLGGGSNIVISDEGFNGMVIKNELRGVHENAHDDHVEFAVGAGEIWDEFVAHTVTKGFGELANLSLIPGTVGAAPVQNIGAYGREVNEFITTVAAIHKTTGEEKVFTNAECQFSYRNSLFKTPDGKQWIITQVTFRLNRAAQLATSYKDIEVYAQQQAIGYFTPQSLRQAIIAIRTAKLPDVKVLGTAGSFFKNPIVPWATYVQLAKQYPALPSFPVDASHVKIPAGWLLDKVCNVRGMRDGNVGVYEQQALVLVNYGNATATELFSFAQKLISLVKEKTTITLEPEVEFV